MIAQQLLGLVQELAFMLCAGSFITPSQLPQNLYPCRLTHCFIHSGHGNPTSGATYPFTALCTSSRVTKLLAQFVGIFQQIPTLQSAAKLFTFSVLGSGRMSPPPWRKCL